MPRRPLDVLEASIGESVTVLLKDDTRYVGTLAGYDQHLNVVLEDAAIDDGEGESTGADDGDEKSRGELEDTIVIRGDNVVSITP